MLTGLKSFLTKVTQLAPQVGIDALAVAGAGLIAAGVYMIYPPGAFIVGGGALIGLSVLWQVR